MKKFTAVVLAVLAWVIPVPIFAQSWEIMSFHADINVEADGAITVQETIETNFHVDKHGIFRDIPVKYRNRYNQHISLGFELISVTDETGSPLMYDLTRSGAYRQIKIGDPEVYISGPQTYVITYRAERGLRYLADHDELYWNVTGTEWEVPITDATATVTLPFADMSGVETICYTGPMGSTAQECLGTVVDGRAQFSANDFLTVAVSWPKGLIPAPSAWKRIGWFVGDNWGFAIPLLALAAGYYVWSRRGRDPQGRGVVRQYEAPDKLSPAEMGFLVKQKFDNDFIAAEVIAMAEAGALTIKEKNKDGWLSKADYELARTNANESSLKQHQRVLLNALFQESPDDKMNVSDLPSDFYKDVQRFSDQVWQSMQAKQYFAGKPETALGAWIAAAIGVEVVLFVLAALFAMRLDLLLGAIFSGAILLVFAVLMPKRTEAGVAAYQHALGFKQYIEAAETERVKWQEKQNLFFDVLPYAMVFGVADKWAKAFEGRIQQPPEWYSGSNVAGFSPARFTSSLNAFSASTVSHSSPPSSSSSGFSGGSSGGGGGGGGGGSW